MMRDHRRARWVVASLATALVVLGLSLTFAGTSKDVTTVPGPTLPGGREGVRSPDSASGTEATS